MDILLHLATRFIPFYFTILLGYIAGRYLKMESKTIGTLLLYIITPIVVFHAVVATPITSQNIALPILFFSLASLISICFYLFSKHLWIDSTRNIVAYAVGSANSGFFGLPIALALWGNTVFNTIVLCMLGWVIYDSTVGFWIALKGNTDHKNILNKLLQLPSLYSIIIALILNLLGINTLGNTYENFILQIQSTFITLGPLLIGLALAHTEQDVPDLKTIIASFFTKFCVWPALMVCIIGLDKLTLHLFLAEWYQLLLFLSLLPFAANTVALAATFNLQPQKTAALTAIAIIFASLYLPLILSLISKPN